MDLRAEYRKSLKPLEVEEWVDLLIYRPLGFLVAVPLSFTPITPNLVTFISVLVGLGGAAAIALGTVQGIFWGALLYAFANVLDCTDGQLARITGKFSRYGRIFDGVADYVVGLATFIGIGIGWQPEGYNPWAWWLLVIIGGMICTPFQIMFLNHIRESYLHVIYKNHTRSKTGKRKRSKHTRRRKFFLLPFFLLYRLYLNVERNVRRMVKVPGEMADPEKRTKGLQTVLILWTFTGKGTHVTLLAIYLLMQRPQEYFWFTLIPWNLWILATWIGHKRVTKFHTKRGVPEL